MAAVPGEDGSSGSQRAWRTGVLSAEGAAALSVAVSRDDAEATQTDSQTADAATLELMFDDVVPADDMVARSAQTGSLYDGMQGATAAAAAAASGDGSGQGSGKRASAARGRGAARNVSITGPSLVAVMSEVATVDGRGGRIDADTQVLTGSPDTPSMLGASDASSASNALSEPNATSALNSSNVSSAPNALSTSGTSGTPNAASAPNAPNAANASGAPNTTKAPTTSNAPTTTTKPATPSSPHGPTRAATTPHREPPQSLAAALIDDDRRARTSAPNAPQTPSREASELDTARATAYADTIDALYAVIADQRGAAAALSRRINTVLMIVICVLLVTVATGVAQSIALRRLTRENTGQQQRIEQLMLNQQATLASFFDTDSSIVEVPNRDNANASAANRNPDSGPHSRAAKRAQSKLH